MDKDFLELIDKITKLLSSYNFEQKAKHCDEMVTKMFEDLVGKRKTTEENLNKIIEAYKSNKKDIKNAIKNDDYEEQARCEGYESALTYVLALFKISIND